MVINIVSNIVAHQSCSELWRATGRRLGDSATYNDSHYGKSHGTQYAYCPTCALTVMISGAAPFIVRSSRLVFSAFRSALDFGNSIPPISLITFARKY